MKPIPLQTASQVVLGAILFAWLSMLPVMFLSGISLNIASLKDLAVILSGLAPFLIYSTWRRMAVVPEALLCVAAVLALAVPILIWTYAAMRINIPLADQRLAQMDEALGFDWVAFIAFVDARPLLANALAHAYSSFAYQLLVLPPLLALFGLSTRACAMIMAYMLACLLSSAIGIWYPALGTYATYDVSQENLSNINIWFGYFFIEQFETVRSTAPFELVLDQSAGILTFPSVHAAVAVICAWAAWEVKALRYPFALLNLLMGVSAVSHGSHYLIDIVAGIGVAAFCISVSTVMFYAPAKKSWPVAALTPRASPSAASD